MQTSAIYGESGYERIERDAYYTPAWCTETLLRHVEFEGLVWECAAGNGQMSEVLVAAGLDVRTSDIEPISPVTISLDYLNDVMPWDISHVVTNPPYAQAQAFIERALEDTQSNAGKVAMLLRNEYDSAKTRAHLFGDCPQFALKLVLTKRPKWFADDKASPRHNFSWFVWGWAHEGPAEIRWDQ